MFPNGLPKTITACLLHYGSAARATLQHMTHFILWVMNIRLFTTNGWNASLMVTITNASANTCPLNLSFNHATAETHSLGFDNIRLMPLTKIKIVKTTHGLSIRWGEAHQWHTNKETCESATSSLTIQTVHQPNAPWGVVFGQPQMLAHSHGAKVWKF